MLWLQFDSLPQILERLRHTLAGQSPHNVQIDIAKARLPRLCHGTDGFFLLMHPAEPRKLRIGKALGSNRQPIDSGVFVILEAVILRRAGVHLEGDLGALVGHLLKQARQMLGFE